MIFIYQKVLKEINPHQTCIIEDNEFNDLSNKFLKTE